MRVVIKASVGLSVLLTGLLLFCAAFVSMPAFAQQDLNCDDFSSQEEAQAELESDPDDPNNLDADDDGQACDTFDFGDGSGSGDGNDDNDDVVSGDQSNSPPDQQTDDCPGAEEVLSESAGGEGDGNASFGPFEINGDTFRVTVAAEPAANTPGAGVSVGVSDETLEGVPSLPVRDFDVDAGETVAVLVNNDNDSGGQFNISTGFVDASFTVTVEDCVGTSDEGTNGDTTNDGTTNDDDGNDANNDDGNDANNDVIDDTIPDKDLPDTGGSPELVAGGAVLLLLYGALVAWRLKTRER